MSLIEKTLLSCANQFPRTDGNHMALVTLAAGHHLGYVRKNVCLLCDMIYLVGELRFCLETQGLSFISYFCSQLAQ